MTLSDKGAKCEKPLKEPYRQHIDILAFSAEVHRPASSPRDAASSHFSG